MATYQDGNRRRATPNSRTAASRSAENRQCPKCQRKSALKFISDDTQFGSVCRWEGCGYSNLHQREVTTLQAITDALSTPRRKDQP